MIDKKEENKKGIGQLFSALSKKNKKANNSITELFMVNKNKQDESVQDAEIVNREEEPYILQQNKEVNLSSGEVFVATKILLESRELEKNEINQIVTGFISHSENDSSEQADDNTEEMHNTEEIHEIERIRKHLAGPLLDLVNCINGKYRLKLHYIRQDRKTIQRIITPIKVMFSRSHMYLFAYLNETTSTPVMYRLDRLLKWKVIDGEIEVVNTVRFEEREIGEYIQIIKPEEMMSITLKVKNDSLEKVFDKLPTAEIKKQENDYSILNVEIYVAETLVWIQGQKEYVEILEPKELVE